MKVVADENIPLVRHYFQSAKEIILKPGRSINRDDVKQADILLVRSVTSVNQDLLEGSKIKFVGSTTTGSDHLDINYLNESGIQWSTAKGCNAVAVAEYIVCVVAALEKQAISLKNKKAAVIGVGLIGHLVSQILTVLGMEVVLCDPPKAVIDPHFKSTDFDDIRDVDLITLHVPLTKMGPYPTYHLIKKNFLQRQKQNCILLNTSRGAVIDFQDLKQFGQHLIWCLDVWENEPNIDLNILKKSKIGTPHIAGYSLQSKLRGIEMIYHSAEAHGILPAKEVKSSYPSRTIPSKTLQTWYDVWLALWDPRVSTIEMKEALLNCDESIKGNLFDALRAKALERYESHFVNFENLTLPSDHSSILDALKNCIHNFSKRISPFNFSSKC